MGWTAWIGYNTTAPIEVEAMLKYLAPYAPWLHAADHGRSDRSGLTVHCSSCMLFVAINALGSSSLPAGGATLTWAKIASRSCFRYASDRSTVSMGRTSRRSPDGFAPYGCKASWRRGAQPEGSSFPSSGFATWSTWPEKRAQSQIRHPCRTGIVHCCCARQFILACKSPFIGALDQRRPEKRLGRPEFRWPRTAGRRHHVRRDRLVSESC